MPTARHGDVVRFTAKARNNASTGGCDTTNANVILTLPAADGSANGMQIVLAKAQNFPYGSSVTFGVVAYTVAVNPGVTSFTVKMQSDGTENDSSSSVTGSVHLTKYMTTVVTP